MAEIFIRKEAEEYKPKYGPCEVAEFWRDRQSGALFQVIGHKDVVNMGFHRIVLHPVNCPLGHLQIDDPKKRFASCPNQSSIFEHDLVKQYVKAENLAGRS